MRRFSQVDVFSAEPLLGNPVAVVHDADGITDEEMARFARWTNLSETTFLLSPTQPGADYRLRICEDEIVDAGWVDNGPGWVAVLLTDAEAVLALKPDFAAFGDLEIGVVGSHGAGADAEIEVRAFVPTMGIGEDPVTGSLNAGIAQWLAGDRLPASYVSSQGTVLGRRGRVHIETEGDTIWVGGDALTTVTGEVAL